MRACGDPPVWELVKGKGAFSKSTDEPFFLLCMNAVDARENLEKNLCTLQPVVGVAFTLEADEKTNLI